MKVNYKTRSICKCGFTILSEKIPLGTTYEIELDSISGGTLECGGCGAFTKIKLVFAHASEFSRGQGGYLPLGIFEKPGEEIHENKTGS